MEIPDQLLCIFSTRVEERDGTYTIEIPKRELELGQVEVGETYRLAMLPTNSKPPETDESTEPDRDRSPPGLPVEEGETRDVEIVDIGDQDDGIARVERGFVVIVPDAEKGERVTVEITEVRENVAFADVEERLSYYD
jgi:predicted RNA-binding protein with TRAM domain